MIISVRPNLNNKDLCSIHEGRLGRVLEHRARLSFVCVGSVVRRSGVKAAQSGNKYPHAALMGRETDFIAPPDSAPLIRFNPIVDADFHADGAPLTFPCVVSVVGWRFYLVG